MEVLVATAIGSVTLGYFLGRRVTTANGTYHTELSTRNRDSFGALYSYITSKFRTPPFTFSYAWLSLLLPICIVAIAFWAVYFQNFAMFDVATILGGPIFASIWFSLNCFWLQKLEKRQQTSTT